MNAQELLQEISDYCRQTGLAESTFGRRAVNDGKLASRLRNGGRITTETLDRIRGFMATNRERRRAPAVIARTHDHRGRRRTPHRADAAADNALPSPHRAPCRHAGGADPQRNFRFFDNRQKYLLFVNTCTEKWVVANRVALELANIHPRPPAVRAVRRRRRRRHRAGARDALDARPLPAHAVLRRRQGDQPRGRAPHAAEDVGPLHRASGDRAGADQPRLRRCALARGEIAVSAASSLVWHEVALTGTTVAPVRAADHRPGAVPRRELEGRRQPQDRQSGLRAAGRAGDLSRGPQVPARPDHPEARRHARRTTIS